MARHKSVSDTPLTVRGAKIVFWAFIVGIIIALINRRAIQTGNYIPSLNVISWLLFLIALIGLLSIGYGIYIKREF